MEALVLIVWIVIALLRIILRGRKPMAITPRPETLCRTCVNVHMVKGFRGKELISCTFGGTLRRMKFEVRECTGHSNRLVNISSVRVTGFVPDERKVYAKIRIT